MERIAIVLLCIAASSCAKHSADDAVRDNSVPITINEVYAAGTHDAMAPENAGDWLELHNAGATVALDKGEWFLTDDRKDLLKFELPGFSLDAKSHVRIWCDGRAGEGIHANFRLASEGEWLALVHLVHGRPMLVDSVTYAPQPADGSLHASRVPDGSATWNTTLRRTPGVPNTGGSEAYGSLAP